ncbi:MAG: hypothetical protein KJ060_07335, partial [Candidatus Hydrogenedentes bacterium]|nr:hypothetical protein [Candidatus Hydrogenedentota bacterium]
MPKSRKWINLAILALFVAFGYGVVELYVLQFARGDVYPPYSSLRADPVGTRALYESLSAVPGVSVQRHMEPFSRDSVAKATGNLESTWLFLGVNAYDPDHMPIEIAQGMEQILQRGGRVVVAFEPTHEDLREVYEIWEAREERIERMRDRRTGEEEAVEAPEEPDDEEESETEEPTVPTDPTDRPDRSDQSDNGPFTEDTDSRDPYDALYARINIPERWGVRLEFDTVQVDDLNRMKAHTATRVADIALPESVTWHNVIWFDELSEEWKTIYARDEKPLIVERPFGAGTMVFVSDSYFLSNEALQKERHPALLAWLIGPHNRIVFEESVHGVARAPGIMTLMRVYGLYGVFWSLIGLAILYLWKNGVSFVPPYDDARPSDARHAVGRDSAAGFANLIRRSVPVKDLLEVCLAQYKHAIGARRDALSEPIHRM